MSAPDEPVARPAADASGPAPMLAWAPGEPTTVPASDDRWERWHRPALLLVAGVVVAIFLVSLPTILREQTRDWIAYQQAAARLQAGGPLYIWTLATPDDEYYLYPPGMAAAWAVVGSPALLVAVKLASLLAVGLLTPMVVGSPSGRRAGALLICAGALIWPPNVYDIVLGNVMVLYVGAAAIVIARRGWSGALPLGVVLALAAKPAALPLLIWLALRHPRDAGRVIVVAALASLLVVARFGIEPYLEYLGGLPHLSTMATTFSGNVGLITVSALAAVVGIGAGWLAGAAGALWLDERAGAAVALAAMLIAQPTIGFNYAGVLYPALLLLWGRDWRVGAAGFVIGTPTMLVSPIAAALLAMGLGLAAGLRGTRRISAGAAAA